MASGHDDDPIRIETNGGLVATTNWDGGHRPPRRFTATLTTSADNQTRIEVRFLKEGDDPADGRRSQAKFEVTSIPPAPMGVPRVEVAFEIDANGIVAVSAQDQVAALDQRCVVPPSARVRLVEKTREPEAQKKDRD